MSDIIEKNPHIENFDEKFNAFDYNNYFNQIIKELEAMLSRLISFEKIRCPGIINDVSRFSDLPFNLEECNPKHNTIKVKREEEKRLKAVNKVASDVIIKIKEYSVSNEILSKMLNKLINSYIIKTDHFLKLERFMELYQKYIICTQMNTYIDNSIT